MTQLLFNDSIRTSYEDCDPSSAHSTRKSSLRHCQVERHKTLPNRMARSGKKRIHNGTLSWLYSSVRLFRCTNCVIFLDFLADDAAFLTLPECRTFIFLRRRLRPLLASIIIVSFLELLERRKGKRQTTKLRKFLLEIR